MINFNKTEFIKSASSAENLIDDEYPQIAIVGRSNVGKSSLLNAITNQKKLAKTSRTPGRTRLVNYFLTDKKFYIVDLPGYGYAKGSKEEQAKWDSMIGSYFNNSKKIHMVIILMDIRRDVTALDREMQQYLFENDIPYKIILTKSDKLSNNEKFVQVRKLCQVLRYNKEALVITSSEKRQGLEDLKKIMTDSIEEDSQQ